MADSAFGTLLKIGDGGGTEVFTTIADVIEISGPSLQLETEDVLTHSSVGAWRQRIATFLDGGEVSFEILYNPNAATHNAATGLLRDLKNRVLRNFQLVFPVSGNPTWAFAAFVTGFEPGAPADGMLTASVTLQLSGQPTLV
jgi:hypothetical protein